MAPGAKALFDIFMRRPIRLRSGQAAEAPLFYGCGRDWGMAEYSVAHARAGSSPASPVRNDKEEKIGMTARENW
jgi:hypothetical protein